MSYLAECHHFRLNIASPSTRREPQGTMIELCVALQLLLLAAGVICHPSIRHLSDCLNEYGIRNFTTFSGDPSYGLLLNFSIHNLRFAGPAVPKPAAIVLPGTAREVVKSVRCSRAAWWDIRVRSGGHSYEGTSYMTTDGAPFVIIDLMNLNRVNVDLASETAWVEAGATLGELYHAISQASPVHGFPGGNCHTVGAGGHIAGGGFGKLSRKYGLAADNVVDSLLVTDVGEVLDRDAMGEDVFWALRGGGVGTLGIVLAWKIKIVKIPRTVTGCMVYRHGNINEITDLVQRWQLVAPNLQEDLSLSCAIGASEKLSSWVRAKFTIYFLGRKPQLFSTLNLKLPELELQETECREQSWIEGTVYFSGLHRDAAAEDLLNRYAHDKRFFKAKSDYATAVIPRRGIETALEYLRKEPHGYVIMHPYRGVMDRISSDAIAFPHRRGNLFSIQYLVLWQANDDWKSRELLEWIREFHEAMTPFMSKSPRPAYISFMDFDIGVMPNLSDWSLGCQENGVELARTWGERYFLGNYERLVRAKTQIDPDNVFRHEQGIPPICSTR